jgi:tRNA A37 threonylcarbamoyladenosine modification protein TsaB
VIPLSSLQIRAAIVRTEKTLALLDARKGRVYAQFFDTRSIIPVALSAALDVPLDTLEVPAIFHAVGEGVDRYRKELEELSAEIPLDACRSPGLEAAEIAWALKDTAVSPEEVQLNYIRPPDAKIPKSVGTVVGTPAPK